LVIWPAAITLPPSENLDQAFVSPRSPEGNAPIVRARCKVRAPEAWSSRT